MSDTQGPEEAVVAEPETEAQRQQSYAALAKSEDFHELRKRYRGFAFPWTIAFMVWYLLYVICANWAQGFMTIQLFGNINVALVFGLAQFASTFLIAALYARHANRKLDPLADKLSAQFHKEASA